MLFLFLEKKSLALEDAVWVYAWASGTPSTHAALLSSVLYSIYLYEGFGPLFGFGFTVSLLLLYDLRTERKKQTLLEEYFVKSENGSLKQAVGDGRLLDISGHTSFDVAIGIFFGVLASFLIFSVFID